MAKRSMRSKSRDNGYSAAQNVHPLFPPRGGWSPHDQTRIRATANM